jgi:hypothetical protein
MSKIRKAIEVINFLGEAKSKYSLAVDEDSSNLKSKLEGLGYKVLSFPKGLSHDDVNMLLIDNKVKYFMTKNKDDFVKFRNVTPSPTYHLLRLSSSVFGNVDQLARVIEKAIMFDSRIKGAPNLLDIDSIYMNNLSKLIKKEKTSQRNKER